MEHADFLEISYVQASSTITSTQEIRYIHNSDHSISTDQT